MPDAPTPPDVEARLKAIDREADVVSTVASQDRGKRALVYRRHVEALLTEREAALHREAALASQGYRVEVSWSWGASMRFPETSRFWVRELSEVPAQMEATVKRIADCYAFDCGRVDHPLHPVIHAVTARPDAATITLPCEYDAALEAAVQAKKEALAPGGPRTEAEHG